MKNWGIHKQVLFIALTPMIIISLVLLFYYIQAQTQSLYQALDDKGNLLAKRIATASEYALQTGNIDSTQDIVNAALQELDVVTIEIKNSAGELLLSRNNSIEHDHNPQITYKAPILTTEIQIDGIGSETEAENITQNTSLGYVYTTLTSASTKHKQNEVIFNSIFITLIGILTSTIVALRIGTSVTKPIISLTNAVHKISDNQLDTRVDLKSGGELGELEMGINHMTHELQEFHEHMQSRIDTATTVLRGTIDQLQKKNLELDKARDEAVAANRMKSEFLGNISHEILTPINNIIGSNNLLTKITQSNEQRKYNKIITEASQNLVTIVHNILDLSRIETGSLALSHRHFNFRDLLEDVVLCYADKAFDKHLELTLLFYDDVPTQLAGDPQRIRQILATLIDNAIKFTNSGFITIRVMLEDEKEGNCTLKISIADTGIGIDPDTRDMIFKAFTQADLSKTKEYSGVGLGLVIANTLIQRMNGTLDFTSEPGIGTTFWFTVQTELKQPLSIPENTPTVQNPGINALIAGKHPVSRLSIIHAIKYRVNGIQETDDIETLDSLVNEAASGPAPVNIILLTITRDEAKAHELESILNRITAREHCTIIALTDSTDKQVFREIESMGVDKCISKAFKKEDLSRLLDLATNDKNLAQENPRKILIADDNQINRHLLNTLLTQAGYICTEAEDGKRTVQLAKENPYDLIFMDIHMPVMDGIEATREIRMQDNTNALPPIVAITANVTSEMEQQIIEAGMNDYLTKPVFENQLYECARKWLSPTSRTQIGHDTHKAESLKHAASHPSRNHIGFDWDKAMKITGNNADLAETLFEMFLADIPELQQKLNRAFLDNNIETLKAISHKIHGAAAYCAASKIDHIAGQLEKATLRNQQDLYPGLVGSLNAEIEQILRQKAVT